MNSAGRILIMPKGEWKEETEYKMLDIVRDGGRAWICKKPCKGIKPSTTDETYWHDLLGMALNYIPDELVIKGYGVVGANDVYTALSAKKDSNNVRYIRVLNQLYTNETPVSVQFIEVENGEEKAYSLFGEHNIPYLKQLLGLE